MAAEQGLQNELQFPHAAGEEELVVEEDGVEVVDEEGHVDEDLEPYDPSKTRIDSDRVSLDVLIRRIQHDEIELHPDFQRAAELWSPAQMSQLIESLLLRIPLPAFYFDGTNDDKWLVVDGLQRLSTFKRFIVEDQGQGLRLRRLEYLTELEGKTFSELSRAYQRRIEETQVHLHIIRPGTPARVKYNIFKRINTGGLILSTQEIRHALNPGPALALLHELAKSEAFLHATGGTINPRRMLDRELVLRYMAFAMHGPHRYRGNMDDFLTRSLQTLNQQDQLAHERLSAEFIASMETCYQLFGRQTFRKQYQLNETRRKPVNRALYESWSYWLSPTHYNQEALTLLIARKDRLRALQIEHLSEDHEFESAVSQGTNDPGKLKLRFERVQQMIETVLSEARR